MTEQSIKLPGNNISESSSNLVRHETDNITENSQVSRLVEYTAWGNWGNWQNERIEKSNLVDVETRQVYSYKAFRYNCSCGVTPWGELTKINFVGHIAKEHTDIPKAERDVICSFIAEVIIEGGTAKEIYERVKNYGCSYQEITIVSEDKLVFQTMQKGGTGCIYEGEEWWVENTEANIIKQYRSRTRTIK